MDWANEDYVRVYRRETDDDLLLSWDAISVWRALLVKFDRSGVVETRRGVRGLAAMIRCSVDMLERALEELIEDGRLQRIPNGYFARNFMTAQEAPKSDKARQRDSRAQRAAKAAESAKPMPGVTFRDQTSRGVTDGHTESQPVTLTLPSQSNPSLSEPRAHAILPSTEPSTEPSTSVQELGWDIRVRHLVTRVWNYATQAHNAFRADGVDPAAGNAWAGVRGYSDLAMRACRERVEEQLRSFEGDFDVVEARIRNRIDVAFAEARAKQIGDFVIPARMWGAESFGIAVDLSPAQAARPRAPPRSSDKPANTEIRTLRNL